jgi:hypothetical protein
MINRYGTALAAILLAAGLTACGGGSEFKTKMTEMCKKEGGKIEGLGAVDCECAVGVLDAELDADTKEFMLKMVKIQDSAANDPAKAMEAMKEAGIDPTNPESMKKLEEMGKKFEGLDEKVKAKCKA